ncbi:MAG TPA: hypothetical protein VL481_02765 [Verrucomicrobiae bacterium]|nr:hypothetical protein [Verrucomicrobiae bacterium]
MTKVGILVHCRHLETVAWEELVYGIPAEDKLGDLATLARVILTLEPTEEVSAIVIGRGPSWKDGLNEGEYTKQFLIDHLNDLQNFPRLKPLLRDGQRVEVFEKLAKEIIVTSEVKNTVAEMGMAARLFTERGIEKVIQITAASHAPRCIKEQAVARSHGVISKNQLWQTVATDMAYHDTKPEDVAVIEPLHRRDQLMTFMRPGFSEVIAPYFFLPDADKKELVKLVADFMASRK